MLQEINDQICDWNRKLVEKQKEFIKKKKYVDKMKKELAKKDEYIEKLMKELAKKDEKLAMLKAGLKQKDNAKNLTAAFEAEKAEFLANLEKKKKDDRVNRVAAQVLQSKTDALERGLSALEMRVDAIAALCLAVNTLKIVENEDEGI